MRSSAIWRGGLLMATVVVGCARVAAPPAAPGAADLCALHGSIGKGDTIRVALDAPVGPAHAPTPATDAERLVFRQLYEPPVSIDCTGAVRAGLALRWRSDDGGRRWTFVLRPGAVFWDGTPVDAAALSDAWRRDTTLRVDDVRSDGPGTIVVTLAAARRIESFADPAWSAVKRIPESPWPIGTGAVWVNGWTGTGADSLLVAAPAPAAPAGTPTLAFHSTIGRDPRDLLDEGVDALVTRDPAAGRYAAGRGDWRVAPLPWDRVYMLLSPARVAAGIATQLDRDKRTALARDAVRTEARAPEEPAWWTDRSCEPLPPRVRAMPRTGRVVVPQGDAVARDLADRLVARADGELTALLGAVPQAVRTAALDGAAFDTALASGSELAYVLPLPRAPEDGCRATAELLARVPWLSAGDGSVGAAAVPLVETRSYFVVRDRVRAYVDRDGGVRLTPRRDGGER